MIWWLAYGAIGLGLVAFMFLFVGRIRSDLASGQRLPLSDYVAVVGAALNVVFLVIAVISLHVAVTTYNDAKRSGDEQTKVLQASRDALAGVAQSLDKQEDTLEKSRQALDSSVESAIAQQDLLSESVRNSKEQLGILRSQWVRELEQPDASASFYYPQEPSIQLFNRSAIKPARDANYQLIALNLNKVKDRVFQLVQTATTSAGTLFPKASYIPTKLNLLRNPDQPLSKGDRIFGYLIIDCPDCKQRRAYWFLIRFEEDGWYREMVPPFKSYLLDKITPESADATVDDFMKNTDLIRIPKTWDEGRARKE
jgi:hypothetical protein